MRSRIQKRRTSIFSLFSQDAINGAWISERISSSRFVGRRLSQLSFFATSREQYVDEAAAPSVFKLIPLKIHPRSLARFAFRAVCFMCSEWVCCTS